MTYKEFFASPERVKARLCRVTMIDKYPDNNTSDNPSICLYLEWENSNCKWYMSQPLEGREEVGYCSDIWLKANYFFLEDFLMKIKEIQIITSYAN